MEHSMPCNLGVETVFWYLPSKDSALLKILRKLPLIQGFDRFIRGSGEMSDVLRGLSVPPTEFEMH
jgi:hypothetical protein